MIISVTERGGFKRCRRQHRYSSFNGLALTPVQVKPALSTGTMWHRGSELWLEDWSSGGKSHFHTIMQHAVAEYTQQLIKALEAANFELWDEDRASLYDQGNLLEAMAINYEGHWGKPLPDGFTNIKAEQTIVTAIPGTDHEVCDGCKYEMPVGWTGAPMCNCAFSVPHHTEFHQLECTLDGLIQSTENGLAYVLERKTYGNRPRVDSLLFNDQFTAYLWVLRQNGFAYGGVAYDGAWKRKGPTKKDMTIGDMFLRVLITHSDIELQGFTEQLANEVNDMARVKADPTLAYPNRRWEGCWDCGFDAVCQAQSRGEDYMALLANNYVKRSTGGRDLVWPQPVEVEVA